MTTLSDQVRARRLRDEAEKARQKAMQQPVQVSKSTTNKSNIGSQAVQASTSSVNRPTTGSQAGLAKSTYQSPNQPAYAGAPTTLPPEQQSDQYKFNNQNAIINPNSVEQVGRGEGKLGELTREQKIANQADLRASAKAGGRIAPLEGARQKNGVPMDEISQKYGATSFGRKSVGLAGQFQALPGEISAAEKAAKSQIIESGQRNTTQAKTFSEAQQEAYDFYSPKEAAVRMGENEDPKDYLIRKQKARLGDLTTTLSEVTKIDQKRQFQEFQKKNQTQTMRGAPAETPTYERLAADDPTLEHNIRYRENLADFEADISNAENEAVRRGLLKMKITSPKAREILEKQLRAQYKNDFAQKRDDGIKQLEQNRKETYKAWEAAQDKAEAKFKQDVIKESQKSKADIENEIWSSQYEGYLSMGATPIEARAKATRDLKIETESDPSIQDMAGAITERIEAGLLQPDDTFEAAMMNLGDAKSARKSLELAGFTTGTINTLQENYQREVLGYDEGTLAQSQFETTISDFYTGENTDIYSLGKFVKDAKKNLSDKFVRDQLSAISTSLSADQDIKSEAAALLSDMGGATPEEKPLTKTQLEAKFLSGGFDSPEEEQQYLDKLERLNGKNKEGKDASPSNLEARYLSGKMTPQESQDYLMRRAIMEGEEPANVKVTTNGKGITLQSDMDNDPITITAKSYLENFNQGSANYETTLTKIGSSKGAQPIKDKFVQLVAEQGGKRVFGQDSGTIQNIKNQIDNLTALKKDDIYKTISGYSRIGRKTGKKGDALAKAANVLTSGTLKALAEAKQNEITFGALSEAELVTVASSASNLASKAEYNDKDNPSKITGFSGSEEGLREDIDALIGSLQASIENKTKKGDFDTFTVEQDEQGGGLQSFKDLGIDRAEFHSLSTPDQKIFSDEFKTNPSFIKELKDLDFTPREMVEFLKQEGGQKKKTETDARTNPEWHSKVGEVAKNIGVSDADLKTVIGIETAGTFNPSIKNPNSSATGFIQFMDSTAKGLGTTTDKIAKMTPVEQMDVVEKYFKNKKVSNLGELYLAIAAPAGLGKKEDHVIFKKGSEAWNVNPGWRNNGGDITVGSIKKFAEKYKGKYS